MADFNIDTNGFENILLNSFGRRLREGLDRDTINAVNKAVNKTIVDIISTADRISKEAYTARSKKYKTKKKKARQMSGAVRFSGNRGFGLYHFRPSPKKPTHPRPVGGVTTQIKRGGTRTAQMIPGFTPPFVARKRQGGYALFVRKRGGRRKDIMYLLGPSRIQAVTRRETREILQEQGEREFLQNVVNEMNEMLAGVTR